MSDQQNVAIVRQANDAFGRGDVDTLVSLLAEAVEWNTPGPKDLPSADRRRGRDQVRQFIGQGETVVVMGVDTVRVKATGNTVNEDWAHVFTVRNGATAKFVEYLDTAALVAGLRSAQAKA